MPKIIANRLTWKRFAVLTWLILLFACLWLLCAIGSQVANSFLSVQHQWEIARVQKPTYQPEVYFAVFLGAHDSRTYEVAAPNLHAEIDEWFLASTPTCSTNHLPDYVGGADTITVFCYCVLTIEGLETGYDLAYSPYRIVTDFSWIGTSHCFQP